MVVPIALIAMGLGYLLFSAALRVSARNRARARGDVLMGYLEGFGVTLRQHRLFGGKQVTTEYSGGRGREAQGPRVGSRRRPRREDRQAGTSPRPSRAEQVRGRDGEVHRLRAVRGSVPGEVHLRPRRRQRPREPDVAGRAVRLRLRDQLPAVHPLRSVRRGVPDRGDHRVEAVRVLVQQPTRRDLHQGRVARRRRRQAQAAPLGGLARRARTNNTSGWMRATSPSGDATFEGVVGWSGELGYGVRAPSPAKPRP